MADGVETSFAEVDEYGYPDRTEWGVVAYSDSVADALGVKPQGNSTMIAGPQGVSLEQAVEWARAHAAMVLIRAEGGEFSAGRVPIEGAIDFEQWPGEADSWMPRSVPVDHVGVANAAYVREVVDDCGARAGAYSAEAVLDGKLVAGPQHESLDVALSWARKQTDYVVLTNKGGAFSAGQEPFRGLPAFDSRG